MNQCQMTHPPPHEELHEAGPHTGHSRTPDACRPLMAFVNGVHLAAPPPLTRACRQSPEAPHARIPPPPASEFAPPQPRRRDPPEGQKARPERVPPVAVTRCACDPHRAETCNARAQIRGGD